MDLDVAIAQLNGIPAAILASAIFAGLGYLLANFRSKRPVVVWGEAPNSLVAIKNSVPGINMQFKSVFVENCGSVIVPEVRLRVIGEFSTVTISPDKVFEIRETPNHLNRKEILVRNLLPKEALRINVMIIRMGPHDGWEKISELEIVSISAGIHCVSKTSFDPVSNHTRVHEKFIVFSRGIVTSLIFLLIVFLAATNI